MLIVTLCLCDIVVIENEINLFLKCTYISVSKVVQFINSMKKIETWNIFLLLSKIEINLCNSFCKSKHLNHKLKHSFRKNHRFKNLFNVHYWETNDQDLRDLMSLLSSATWKDNILQFFLLRLRITQKALQLPLFHCVCE